MTLSPEARFVELGTAASKPLLDVVRFSSCQRKCVEDPRKFVLWRDGNRLGKTVWLAYELAARATGKHPNQRHRPGYGWRGLMMGPTLNQMLISQFIPWVWAFLGGDLRTGDPGPWIDPRLKLDLSQGLRGVREPVIRLVAGPGEGSVIYLASYFQGFGRIGGASIHAAALDEPPPESRWSEVRARVVDTDGCVRIGFTPTLESPDMTYLRSIVEDAGPFRWGHHNFHLKEEHTHIEGHPFPRIRQATIDEFSADMLEREKRMRIEGWWEPQVEGAVLHRFQRDQNVRDFSLHEIARRAKDAVVCVGLDHGLQAGKQRAVLVVCADVHSLSPRAWWTDEEVSTGETTTRQDAQSVLAMLKRNGLRWRDVDVWVGDRAAQGKGTVGSRKSNDRLRRAMHQLLLEEARTFGGHPPDLSDMPKISTPRKYDGSVWDGARQMNDMFGTRDADGIPHGLVHPRCEEFIAACEKWDGGSKHPLKDVFDAARYPVERVCRREVNLGRVSMTQRAR